MKKIMPIGPLMMEHRLIERMIGVIEKELNRLENEELLVPTLIDTFIDFIRTYADRCHHGKEEDIFFRELKQKSLSSEHEKILYELIEEHTFGRKLTKQMAYANMNYVKGDGKSFETIVGCMKTLVDFYPQHIEKEDKHFFIPVMQYFSSEEKDSMLKEGFEFDKNLIHTKYQDIVARAEELSGKEKG